MFAMMALLSLLRSSLAPAGALSFSGAMSSLKPSSSFRFCTRSAISARLTASCSSRTPKRAWSPVSTFTVVSLSFSEPIPGSVRPMPTFQVMFVSLFPRLWSTAVPW